MCEAYDVRTQEGAGFAPYPEPEYGRPQPVQHHEYHDQQQQHQSERDQQWAEDVAKYGSGFSQHEDFARPCDDRCGNFEGPYEQQPPVPDMQHEHTEYSAHGESYSGEESFRGPGSSSFEEWHKHRDPGMLPPLENVSYVENYSQAEPPYSSQDSHADFSDGQGLQPYDYPYVAEEQAYRGPGDPSSQPYGTSAYPEPVPLPFRGGGASYREEPFHRQLEEESYNHRESEEEWQHGGTGDWPQNKHPSGVSTTQG